MDKNNLDPPCEELFPQAHGEAWIIKQGSKAVKLKLQVMWAV
jgi:hypothetical protein